MEKGGNGDIVEHVLYSFFKVTNAKTSPNHSLYLLKYIIEKVSDSYNWKNYISVISIDSYNQMIQSNHDTPLLKKVAIVSPDIERIEQEKVKSFIQSFADTLFDALGKQAGYHLLREFRDNLDVFYYNKIKEMGVDLRLSALQKEIYGWDEDTNLFKIAEKGSDIAYIEKKNYDKYS